MRMKRVSGRDAEGFLGSYQNGAVYRNFGGGMVPRNDNWGSCEVSCCAWAVFKICNYLLRITGKAKYGDWAEQMLINGVAGQPPIDSEGHVMYYAGYFVDGAVKSLEDRRLQPNGANFEWQCCTGTFPQDVAEYANMIYYTDEEGIYVSQYLPSKASFSIRGSRFALENCSGGDISPIRKFRVQAEGGTSCRISFRIPRWAKGVNRILVNGEDMGLSAQPDTWAVLEREWQADDVIEISLPFPWNSNRWMKKTRILRRCASGRWFWRRIRCPCLTGTWSTRRNGSHVLMKNRCCLGLRPDTYVPIPRR